MSSKHYANVVMSDFKELQADVKKLRDGLKQSLAEVEVSIKNTVYDIIIHSKLVVYGSSSIVN